MHFKFLKYTALWFTLSGLLLAVGVGAMIFNKVTLGSTFNYGIDFTGGSLMEYRFETVAEDQAALLREAIEWVLPGSVSQISHTSAGTYLVQTRHLSEPDLAPIQKVVNDRFGKSELLRFNSIGPKIGATLKRRALLALGIAMMAIVLYITYAFRHVPRRVSPWRFGWCAILALLHDVLATVGVFALMRWEVDALFITALLTVIGFSVHDTIVVFDRIRENLKHQGRDDTFDDLTDISLNQTVGRSINTSLSTLITLVALYIFGAPSLQHFLFALIFGITVGTYSSIFIASPLLAWWQEKVRIP